MTNHTVFAKDRKHRVPWLAHATAKVALGAFLLLPAAEAERPVSVSKPARRRPDPTHESPV